MGTEMRTTCPFHDDNNPSMSVNLENGSWYCFAESKGGSYVQLIEQLRRDTNYEGNLRPTTDAPVAVRPMLQSWADRGFTSPMLVKWGIVWDPEMKAMRLPILNDEGDTISNIWRAPEGIEPKYRYDKNFQISAILFGLWRLANPSRLLVLVEGPLDAIWLQEAGVPGVSILGGNLSDVQLSLLEKRRVHYVCLCFDNDDAGRQATIRAIGKLRSAGLWVYRVIIPDKYKDIQEVPFDRVNEIVERRELAINGVGIIHPSSQRWLGGVRNNDSPVWRRK